MLKGRKRVRGVSKQHDDELKLRVNLTLSPTGITGLDSLAADRGLSRSGLVEQIGRFQILLADRQNHTNVSDSLGDMPMEEITAAESPNEFTMSEIQAVPLNQSHDLPESPGAYIITDFAKNIYVGHDPNLKRKFMDARFQKRLEKFLENKSTREQVDIVWIECSNVKALPTVKQALIVSLHTTTGIMSVFIEKLGRETILKNPGFKLPDII